MSPIEQKVREFISKELLLEGQAAEFDSDTPLLEKGIIDSIGLVRLIAFFEESLNIRIPDEDLRAENFQSITHVVNYLEGKRGSDRAEAS